MIAETERETFVWLTGHLRNVGDSVLRRPFADALRRSGPIRVWAGDHRSGYVRGLRLHEGEAKSSFFAWYVALVWKTIVSRPNFAFNPGEFRVTKHYFFGLLLLLPWLLLVRIKGGKIVWLGAGVASRRAGFMWPFDLLARWSNLLMWRDSESSSSMGRGSEMPDWAFAPGTGQLETLRHENSSTRGYVAVSLRGDREYPTSSWLEATRAFAARLQCQIVVIVQVSEDDAMAERLARDLGAEELVPWFTSDHWAQEQEVRGWYRRSAVVLSDRLHALIMGATEGAIPLGWCEQSTRKISIHMEVVGANWSAPDLANTSDQLDKATPAFCQSLSVETVRVVAQAAQRVAAVEQELLATLRQNK